MTHQELAAALEDVRTQQRTLNNESRTLAGQYNAAVVAAMEAIDVQIAEQRAAVAELDEQTRALTLEKRALEATLIK